MCTELLPCPLCSQPHFNTLESLRIGLIKVATENLTCPVCKDTFMGLDKLTIHLFSHCESDQTRPEADQSLTEPNKKAAKIQKTHINSEITSAAPEEVKMPSFNMSTLPFIGVPNDTKKNHSNQNGKTLSEQCDICGFYFIGKNILQMHKKLIHNLQEESNNVKANKAQHSPSKHSCHVCNKTFKMRGSLMVHLRMVHSDPSSNQIIPKNQQVEEKVENVVKFTVKPLELKPQLKVDEVNNNTSPNNSANNKQWECDICRKMFTTKYFLKKHKRLHTGEMPYSCSQCHKTFTFQQSYHKHLLYHNDDKPHICSHCGRAFKELSTLHNHQRIHTGEKPFSCESCGKCFRQRVSYLVHRRIHTGVMPYKCTACNKSFRYKVSQRTHKCTAQPPGTVVRQSGELVQKLIKNQPDIFCEVDVKSKPNFLNDPMSTANNDNLDQTIDFSVKIKQDEPSSMGDEGVVKRKIEEEEKNIIDEILKDSIRKIDFGELGNYEVMDASHFQKSEMYKIDSPDASLPSPSEKFKDLRLSSNHGSPNIGGIVPEGLSGPCESLNFLQGDFQKDKHDYVPSNAVYHDNLMFNQIFP